VLTTTDINGGTIDGVTIGGSSAGDITYANLSDGTITITAFVDEDDMSSDSATLVPTQQSVKAYVDAQVTAQDFDFSADTGGSLSIDLDSEAMTFTGGTGIDTSGSGNAVTFAIDSTVTTLTGSQTLTNKVLTSPDINTPDIDGGTIDGTVIGGSSAAAITGTVITGSSLDISGDADIDGTLEADAITVNGTALGEVIADTVGAMVSSNTETNITVTYEDSDNTLDFVIGTLNQDTTGNAATATALETARTIGGVSFDGTADITPTTFTTATFSGDVNVDSGVLFVDVSENKVGINQASPDVSLDLGSNTDAVHVPVGTTAQRPGSAAAGYFRYNTSLSQFEGYTDSWGAIGGGGTNTFTHDVFTCDGSTTAFVLSQSTESENNLIVFVDGVFQEQSAYSIATSGGVTTLTMSAAPANGRKLVVYTVAAGVSGSNLNIDTMTGDGSDTTLTLSINPVNENNTQVFIDGVYQSKANYSISGTTLTFSTAPPNGSSVEVMTMTQTDINVPVDGTITSAKLSGDLTLPGDLSFADSNKAIFGAGSDLQIYHDGSDSYIVDNGTGDLLIRAENNLFLKRTNSDETYLSGAVNGAVTLFHNNNAKIATTISGIDVTGTLVSDGLTVDNNGSIVFNDPQATDTVLIGTNDNELILRTDDGDITLKTNENKQQLRVSNNGDISFYEDTGTTAKLVWDASAESLGIGTSSPSEKLTIQSGNLNFMGGTNDAQYIKFGDTGDDDIGNIFYYHGNNNMVFTTNASEAMRIDASGNLLVGKTSAGAANIGVGIQPSGILVASRSSNISGLFNRTTSDGDIVDFRKDNTTVGSIGTANSGDLYIGNDDTTLLFAGGSDAIIPRGTAGASRDAAIDLGSSNHRFQDLNLSTNIHQGATTPSSSAAGVISEAVGRATYSRGSGTGGFGHLIFINGNGTVGTVVTSGSATAYNTSSDYRLKENVVAMSGATERLKQLKPSRFNFIADADTTVDGFLAHEVQAVVPEAIAGDKDGMMDEEYEVTPAVLDDDGNVVTEAVMGTRSVPDYQGIDQSKLVPLLVATIQELEARITALES
jgi:hypothetical protein